MDWNRAWTHALSFGMLAAVVSCNTCILPARVRDSRPPLLDCPFCEDWTDIVVRDYSPVLDSVDQVLKKLACERCYGRVLLEAEEV